MKTLDITLKYVLLIFRGLQNEIFLYFLINPNYDIKLQTGIK